MDYFRHQRYSAQIEDKNLVDGIELEKGNHNKEFSKCVLTFIQELEPEDQELLRAIEFGNVSQKEMAEKTWA